MSEDLFTQKVHYIRPRLQSDFGLSAQDANAIIGNFGHETGGFEHFQEITPTVPGSRGGFGWPQWTGSRRREFEAYCKRNNLDPYSDLANYGWLWVELTGPEKKVIQAVKSATGLMAKVKAFELSFERAGVKHYASRLSWAKKAKAVPLISDPPLTEPTTSVEPQKVKETSMFGFIGNLISTIFAPRASGSGGTWLGRLFAGGTAFEGAGGSISVGTMEILGDNLAGQPWYIMASFGILWMLMERGDQTATKADD